MASKWVNERFLERVSERCDWGHGLLHHTRRLRAVPVFRHARGCLDFVTIQKTVRDIVGRVLVGSGGGGGGADVRYSHQAGDLVLPLDDAEAMKTALVSHGGRDGSRDTTPYAELPMQEWAARAVEGGMHPAVAALLEAMDVLGARYPRLAILLKR
ncbi:hypothetical protein PG996_004524 [Apiospora saccharicola]|uniref:Uncharacterized protein n=1 Tax=Apiospora saccharicola TaxID=335842 RepID=A0ABR1W4E3_9PEZI